MTYDPRPFNREFNREIWLNEPIWRPVQALMEVATVGSSHRPWSRGTWQGGGIKHFRTAGLAQ